MYNKVVDKTNINTFKRIGTKQPHITRYQCVLCLQKTSIENSFSCSGHKLVCYECAFDKFHGVDALNKLRLWQTT